MRKDRKIIPFGSHEYSLLTLLRFFIFGFFGGQIIGVIPAMFIKFIPAFKPGGYLESISDTCLLLAVFFVNFFIILLLLKITLKTDLKHIISCAMPWKRKFVAGCVIIFMVIVLGFSFIFKAPSITYNPADLKYRLTAFIIALVFVPFQTTVEELIFRCALGRFFFRNRLPAPLWKIFLVSTLSGVLFFLPHLFNSEISAYGYGMAVAQYFFSGFSLMAIDLIVGSYEPSIVIHAINNLSVSLFFCAEVSTLEFPALFIDHSDTMTLDNISVVVMYVLMIIWALIYRKKHIPDISDGDCSISDTLPE